MRETCYTLKMNIGMHHLDTRRRVYEDLEAYPHPKRFTRTFDYLMYTVGALAPLALLPQVHTLFQYHHAAGLSITTWLLLGLINALWMVYGILHRQYPIIIANAGMAFLDFIMVYGIFLFR